MPFKNAPTTTPQALESLITCRPGQISSMSLLARQTAPATAAAEAASASPASASPASAFPASPALLEGALCDTFMLLAFADDESISEETYFSDMLYYLIEGTARITLHDQGAQADGDASSPVQASRSIALQAGELLVVPAQVTHAVHAQGAIKLLQIGLK